MTAGAYLEWGEDALLPPEARNALMGPGAPFEMGEEDVLGAPMRVFARRPRSMRQVLEGNRDRFGEQPFLVFPDRTFTHGSLIEPVSAVAFALQQRYGVGPGDRVAIVAANCPGHALAAWAAVCLGATVVELNGWWTGPEMLHGIGLSEPKVVLGDRRRLERLDGADPGVPVVCFEDELAALEEEGAGRALPPVGIDEDDPLVILFTSGTTGRSKGAALSHRAHIHMMMQASLQGAVGMVLEPASSSGPVPAGPPCSIGVSPMFHISGFSVALIGGALTGMKIAYPPPGRWDPEVHLEMTERHKATAWAIVPTQLWRLLEHPSFDRYDLSSLTRVGGGGSTFQPELWRKVKEKLPHLERMGTGYGMTETCGAGTHQDGRAAERHPEAVGAPVPGYAISVRDPDGAVAAEGAVGEIWMRGPCNLLHYWENPEATARALDRDRWYHTGELGHITGGLLYLDGRGTELIIRGGENIYPIEIENRLVEHPSVAEAAVVGVPDRILGERVRAVVVLHPGGHLDLGAMREWVGAALAGFKVPEILDVVDSLPHNAAGKVMKQLLRDPSSNLSGIEEE
ncbi:MAG TPA: class I adenylate-forming enzyme family protein [Acidimicrobiales bacterium]|nr:class I adenylate-forming enzyme family protein [Acidimicrobiales bacterium]